MELGVRGEKRLYDRLYEPPARMSRGVANGSVPLRAPAAIGYAGEADDRERADRGGHVVRRIAMYMLIVLALFGAWLGLVGREYNALKPRGPMLADFGWAALPQMQSGARRAIFRKAEGSCLCQPSATMPPTIASSSISRAGRHSPVIVSRMA